jgi:putative solute:sodium symporter small subunit
MTTARPAATAHDEGADGRALPAAPPARVDRRRYWRANLTVIAVLMSLWFVVTFVVGFFARDLNFAFFGWPFSFWVASQGALVVYVLIVGAYARTMNRLDRGHGVAEDE